MKPTLEEHAVAEAQRQARNAAQEARLERMKSRYVMGGVHLMPGGIAGVGPRIPFPPPPGTPGNAGPSTPLSDLEPDLSPSDEPIDPAGYLGAGAGNMADDPGVLRACRDSLRDAWEAEKARADKADLEATLLRAERDDARAWAARWKAAFKSKHRAFRFACAQAIEHRDGHRFYQREATDLRASVDGFCALMPKYAGALVLAEEALAYIVEKVALTTDAQPKLKSALAAVRGALGKETK